MSWDDHESERREPLRPGPIVPAPQPDPLIDSHIDIPIERMAREFRKRAGRAFGLEKDIEAEDARAICKAIEDFDRKYNRSR